MQSQAGQTGVAKQQQLGNAISEHYSQLYQLALQQRQALGDVPIIATGHLTAVGASVTESVRDIYIGSLDAFAAQQFPAADYIALGHIHRAQRVAKSEHIRYSGSPIALSFDEVKQQKSVNLVTFDGAKLIDVTELPVPRFQPMQVVKGNLAQIAEQLTALALPVTDSAPTSTDTQTVWLSIEVQEQDYLIDLQNRIAALTEGLPVEVLQVRRARKDREQHLQATHNETLSELAVMDVFQRCLQGVEFSSDAEQARKARIELAFQQIVEQVEHANEDDNQ
jgi:exonuclease SbcD